MKKKILLTALALTLTFTTLTGCQKESTDQTSVSQSQESSTFSGTLEEKKDFMFIVTDSDGLSYAFNFEEKPEGLDDLNVGDTVKVTYTGTVSEIDPFLGEIISIERVAE